MNVLMMLLALILVATPRKLTEPEIRRSVRPTYDVENPLPYRVQIRFNCGPDYELVKFEMEPKSFQQVTVLAPQGKGADDPYCFLGDWKKVEK